MEPFHTYHLTQSTIHRRGSRQGFERFVEALAFGRREALSVEIEDKGERIFPHNNNNSIIIIIQW